MKNKEKPFGNKSYPVKWESDTTGKRILIDEKNMKRSIKANVNTRIIKNDSTSQLGKGDKASN